MRKKIHLWLQYLLPHHLLSRLVGYLAECEWSWWKNLFIRTFIHFYKVDMNEAAETDPTQYKNFNAFFTRALKPDIRPIVAAENQLASPVDGYVGQMGAITSTGKIIQAKNVDYDLQQLLGGSASLTTAFTGGSFATLYLAPHNYHRVHMPLTGQLREMIYVPGQLFSVSPATVAKVADIFTKNERVIAIFDTAWGKMAVILVGAMIVAGIETVWAGTIAPAQSRDIQIRRYDNHPVTLQKGEELGRFKLGSTVILLMQKDRVSWVPFAESAALHMGQLLAYQAG